MERGGIKTKRQMKLPAVFFLMPIGLPETQIENDPRSFAWGVVQANGSSRYSLSYAIYETLTDVMNLSMICVLCGKYTFA